MLANFTVFLAGVLLTTTLYYVIPPTWPSVRQLLVLAMSLLFLWTLTPFGVMAAIGIGAAVVVYLRTIAGSPHRAAGAWCVTAAIIAVLLAARFGNLELGPTIGLSYVAIKAIGVTWQIRRTPGEYAYLSFVEILTLLLFFPIFTAGPIERVSTFSRGKFSDPLQFDNIAHGAWRLLLGTIKVAYFSEQILVPIAQTLRSEIDASPGFAYLYILCRFLTLYVNFSGYTDIAIGCGRLLGLKIIENFNMPLLASSIQEFWQRWHISLGRFMTEFIFRPLLFSLRGRATPAILLTFVIVGMWHAFTWNYLVWGVGHGSMMVMYTYWQRCSFFKTESFNTPARVAWNSAGTVLTVSCVAFLSAFANEPDFASGVAIVRALVGF